MNPDLREVVFYFVEGLALFASFVTLVAAIVTAVRCQSRRLAPIAGWLLAAGIALDFATALGYMAANLALEGDFDEGVYRLYRLGMLVLSLVGILALALVAVGLALFSPRRAPGAQGATHG